MFLSIHVQLILCVHVPVDPEDDFTFSASDEEDDTQLARAIADDMGYVPYYIHVWYSTLRSTTYFIKIYLTDHCCKIKPRKEVFHMSVDIQLRGLMAPCRTV